MTDPAPSAVLSAAQPLAMVASGDVLQKAAVSLYAELERQLHHNRKRTADLRHKHMLQYTAWARRKLSALLAVLQWCNQENTGDFISAVEAIKRENHNVQSRYNEMLDAVFKLHSELYSKVVRPLPVAHARDIIAHGTYPTLPKAIFTRGVMPPPEPLPAEEADPELVLAIQAKLLLLEDWTPNTCRVEFLDGRVVISRDFLFSLSLSMTSRTITSPWAVMEFKILVTSCSDELLISDVSKRGLEMRTLEKLDRIAKALGDKPALHAMLQLCEHVAQSALLNLLYCQSLSVSSTSHAGALESSFFQDVEGYRTVIQLWPREKNYMLGVKLFMKRDVGSPLQGILFCPAAANGVEIFGLRDRQLRELEISIVNEEWTTKRGLSVSRLIDFVTSIAVAQRAATLARVLHQAASKELHKILHIEHTDTRIVISVGRASVTVEVSCMTGEYTAVPACGSFEDLGGFRGVLRRFVTEINELSASDRDYVGAVSMFGKLVACLLLAHWAEVLAAVLLLQPHANQGWSRLMFPGAAEQPVFTCQMEAVTVPEGVATFLVGVVVGDDFSVQFTGACAFSPNAVLARPAILDQHEIRRVSPLHEAAEGIAYSQHIASLLTESFQQFPHFCASRIPERLLANEDQELHAQVQLVHQKDGPATITVLSSTQYPDRVVLIYCETHAFVLLRSAPVAPEFTALAALIGDLQNAAYVSFPCQGVRCVADTCMENFGMMWRVRGQLAPIVAATELRRRALWLLRLTEEDVHGHSVGAMNRIAGIPSITIEFKQIDCPFKQLTFVTLPRMASETARRKSGTPRIQLRLVLPDRSELQYLRQPLEAVADDALHLAQSQDLASVVDALGSILFMTALMCAQSRRGLWRLQDSQLLSLHEQNFLVKLGPRMSSVHIQYTKLNDQPALHFASTTSDENRMLNPTAVSALQYLENMLAVPSHAKAAARGIDDLIH